MRSSFFPLTGSAILFAYRLWEAAKELEFLHGCFIVMSSAVVAYKKRNKLLHELRAWWKCFRDSESVATDDNNQPTPNLDETMPKRNREKVAHDQAGKSTPSLEENRTLKRRPVVTSNQNSSEIVVREPTSFHTPCMMCKKNILINSPSDMPTMPSCYHKFCKPCFESFFSDIIEALDVTLWLCPSCGINSDINLQVFLKELSDVFIRFLKKRTVESANEKLDKWFKSQERINTILSSESFTFYECEMCLKKFQEFKLVGMPSCQHQFCTTCTTDYFTLEIERRDLSECYCPFCVKGEEMNSKEKLSEYFTNLGKILKPHINSDTFQKFEKKLQELVYTDLCIKCYSPVKAPYIWSKYFQCTYCSTRACRDCRLFWDSAHGGMSCKDYELWLREDPCHAQNMSRQPISCVSCGGTFLNVRDRTLLFTCPLCEAQMCRSCRSPFYLGVECPEGKQKCCLLLFHAHHPENCFFYLQHKNVDDLFKFLNERNLHPDKTSTDSYSCMVEVKKVLYGRVSYEICGRNLYNNYLGLCENHAVEFLSSIISKYSLNTKFLFDEDDINIFCKRSWKEVDSKEFEGPAKIVEENKLQFQVPHSSLQHSDTYSSSIQSSYAKMSRSVENVTEDNNETELNVSIQPDVKSLEVPTASKSIEEGGYASPENACLGCSDISDKCVKNIFGCDHNFCIDCIQSNFIKFITCDSLEYLSCPECHRPNLCESSTHAVAYLAALKISLEKILNPNHYELFEDMLRNYTTLLKQLDKVSHVENGGVSPGSSPAIEQGVDIMKMEVVD